MKKDKSLSLNRALILRAIKDNEPVAIYKLEKITKIPRSTLVHHINQLVLRNLVIEKNSEQTKNQKEIGSPVYLSTNQANPMLKQSLSASMAIISFFK